MTSIPTAHSTANPTAFPTPLIRAAELQAWLAHVRVFDARFDLARPDGGEAAFAAGHVPGARYLHLDRDLSAKGDADAEPLCGGRHPLPSAAQAAATFGRFGVRPGQPVVIADEQGGMFAARAWWLLRWLGHGPVAVLDGGLRAWREAGGAVETGASAPPDAADALSPYPLPAEPGMAWVDIATVARDLGRQVLIDARAPERFRGDVEPFDPVAGHIPGALNRPFAANLRTDGRFQDAATLRTAFTTLIGTEPASAVIHHCGSGVTACHNLLAMEAAGLSGSRLYAGSWSEWCRDPVRPVARG